MSQIEVVQPRDRRLHRIPGRCSASARRIGAAAASGGRPRATPGARAARWTRGLAH